MVTRLLKCCFPNSNDKIIKNNDFDTLRPKDTNKENTNTELKPVFKSGMDINLTPEINLLSPVVNPEFDSPELNNQNLFQEDKKEGEFILDNHEKDNSIQSSVKQSKYMNFTKTEEDKLPKLVLKSIIGDAINNETLLISAGGLVNGLRNKRDGITFFGCKDLDEGTNKGIDYELNISNSNLSQVFSSILFFIYFKREEKKYYIKTYPVSKESTNSIPNVMIQIIEPYVS